MTRSGRGTIGGQPDHDAYLLVLLADQELTAGRNDEAAALLDAAYDAFDRCTGDQWGITASAEHGRRHHPDYSVARLIDLFPGPSSNQVTAPLAAPPLQAC